MMLAHITKELPGKREDLQKCEHDYEQLDTERTKVHKNLRFSPLKLRF